MKIVGIIGSARRKGNTDALVGAALDGCERAGAQTERIRLNDLEMGPCRACRTQDGEGCRFHDGVDVVYRALEEADGLIVGTPIYYTTVSAQIKLMIDRSHCLGREVSPAPGEYVVESAVAKHKKGMLVCVSGSDGPEHAWAALTDYWAKEVNLEVVIRRFACETLADDGTVLEPRQRPELLDELRACGEGLCASIRGASSAAGERP
ncbi:MAG TPA: flavodoxin family protein [Thermoleophilia bacterium]|nr:flavodoxin family protein [Thermoleophilia bacterium]